MFRGMATISFYADDVPAARDWYAQLLGKQAYYAYPPESATPAYVEFRVGDDEDELGIIDRRYAPGGASNPPGGAVVFWHVDNLDAVLGTLLDMGATQYEARTEREAGFVTASVTDPFGNVLGIMYNPHHAEVIAARQRA
ncbi:VOC family protein [Tessaracoccus antarcticus]|uniref:VOC family protein n=2 Tax=Tessaracoccus antarcticus TaxID=2479848 RepID=A0A3M0GAB2_9ACTN|nr:VOC family protein [Tessaracoccus antarcticus]